jgi:small subunit ribosomal protein S2
MSTQTITTAIDPKALLEAGCHFGHQAHHWHPKMQQYIYAERSGVHIFDLIQTAKKLEEAVEVARELGRAGKTLVFVGTKRQAQDIVREEAMAVDAPYVVSRWLGGTLTNWEQISKSVEQLNRRKREFESGVYDKYTKKERVLIGREISRLERLFGGIATLKHAPDALFIVDIGKEKAAVKEAVMREVPTIAVVDSNNDPSDITHVIPANDDAVRSIKLLVNHIAKAYAEGKEMSKKSAPKAIEKKPVENVTNSEEK